MLAGRFTPSFRMTAKSSTRTVRASTATMPTASTTTAAASPASCRIGSLHQCKDEAELKHLMSLPDEQLPLLHKRTDQHITGGDWEFFQTAAARATRTRRPARPSGPRSEHLLFDGRWRAPTTLASNTGWGDLCRWVDTLDDAPELKHLTVYGWSQDLPAVAGNLRSALSVNVEQEHGREPARHPQGLGGHDEVMINNGIVAATPTHVAEGCSGGPLSFRGDDPRSSRNRVELQPPSSRTCSPCRSSKAATTLPSASSSGAVARLVASLSGQERMQARRLFDDSELLALAGELAAVRSSGAMLGRALVADHGERVRAKAARLGEPLILESADGLPLAEDDPEAMAEQIAEVKLYGAVSGPMRLLGFKASSRNQAGVANRPA